MLLNIRVVSWSLGIFMAITFILCVLYGLIVPQRLHGMSNFLETVLPAFTWLTLSGFLLGIVETFLYGAYKGACFDLARNRGNTTHQAGKGRDERGILSY